MKSRCRRVLTALVSAIAVAGVLPAASQAAPSIVSFTPTQGALGTTVAINGAGFSGTTSVKFGGIAASFSVLSGTSIHATVPTLARTGKITVTAPSGSVSSSSLFSVLPGIALTSPAGPPGSSLGVEGSGFAANEIIDIYEGTTDVALAITDAYGTFPSTPITVPSSTPPGPFWITAVGRHSGSAAQRSFLVRTSWTNLRGTSGGSGWNRYENVLSPVSVRRLDLMWTTTNGNFLSNTPPGIVAASGLLVTAEPFLSKLVALRTDGSTAWSQSFNASFFTGPTPAEGHGVVVASSTDGKAHAYNLSTGTPKWTTPGPSDTGQGSPVIVGSDVFVPGATQMQDFNLNTGARKWGYAGPCTGNISTPAVSAGEVVFTCTQSGGTPVSLDVSTAGVFRHWFSGASGATAAPAVAAGDAYLLFGGNLAAYSFSLYNPKWTDAPPFAVTADPVTGDGIVVACGPGGIWVVNAADGTLRFSNAAYPCAADPTIANGVIYEPQNGHVTMFDEYGDVLGRLGTGGAAGPPTVVDGSVYVAESISGVDRFGIPALVRAARRPDLVQLHADLTLKP